MATNPNDSPLDEARAAFERLGMPDKTAFVMEATFRTIGEAVADVGQMVADAMTSFDPGAPFGNAPNAEEGGTADEKAPKPAAKRTSPRKPKGGDPK